MIGQQRLLGKLNSYSLSTLPHSILLLGEEGCGKHTIIKYLADKFSLDIIEINDKITQKEIIEYRQSALNKIYLINLAEFNEKQQNQFLKFIEEPAQTNYIILIAESETGILPTIMNRCQVYRFEEYTEAELRQCHDFKNSSIYKIYKTPGSLNNISETDFESMCKYSDNFISAISKHDKQFIYGSLGYLNFNSDYSKYDLRMFIKLLCLKLIKSSEYSRLNKLFNSIINKQFNPKYLYINYITDLISRWIC